MYKRRDQLATHENSHDTRETIAQMLCESTQQNSHASEILAFLVSDLFSMSAMDNLDICKTKPAQILLHSNYLYIYLHIQSRSISDHHLRWVGAKF